MVGKGGNVGFGKFVTAGRGGNCRRWRVAKPPLMLENDKAKKKVRTLKHLEEAII
jgi:hypothetical protein